MKKTITGSTSAISAAINAAVNSTSTQPTPKKTTKKTIKKSGFSKNQRIAARIEDDITKSGMSWGFSLIPISEILRDMAYQRPTKQCRVNEIVRNFNWDKVDCKCVNYRPDEDKFAMMDGLHTLTALEVKGFEYIPCKVFIGKTYQEEAAMFAAQNKGIKKITSVEEFNALVEAGDSDAITILQVLKEYFVELAPQIGLKKVRSVRKLTKIMETVGEAGLRFTFQLIEDAGWGCDGKAYSEAGLNIGWYAYSECLKANGTINKRKYNCLLNILKDYKTSTAYVDMANCLFGETVTKHPENCVKKMVQHDMYKAGVAAQKEAEYQKKYYENVIKVK